MLRSRAGEGTRLLYLTKNARAHIVYNKLIRILVVPGKKQVKFLGNGTVMVRASQLAIVDHYYPLLL